MHGRRVKIVSEIEGLEKGLYLVDKKTGEPIFEQQGVKIESNYGGTLAVTVRFVGIEIDAHLKGFGHANKKEKEETNNNKGPEEEGDREETEAEIKARKEKDEETPL